MGMCVQLTMADGQVVTQPLDCAKTRVQAWNPSCDTPVCALTCECRGGGRRGQRGCDRHEAPERHEGMESLLVLMEGMC